MILIKIADIHSHKFNEDHSFGSIDCVVVFLFCAFNICNNPWNMDYAVKKIHLKLKHLYGCSTQIHVHGMSMLSKFIYGIYTGENKICTYKVFFFAIGRQIIYHHRRHNVLHYWYTLYIYNIRLHFVSRTILSFKLFSPLHSQLIAENVHVHRHLN